jgi:glutamate synthase (NADPH) small chain
VLTALAPPPGRALSVTTIAIGKSHPEDRTEDQPWPMMPNLFEVASAHEEFGERKYLHSTVEFVSENGQVTGLKVADTQFVDGKRVPTPGTERILPADLVLLALGFTGSESEHLVSNLAQNWIHALMFLGMVATRTRRRVCSRRCW